VEAVRPETVRLVSELPVSPLSTTGLAKVPALRSTCHWLDWCEFPESGSEKALPKRVAPVAVIEDTEEIVGVFGAVFAGDAVVKLKEVLQELQFPLLSRYRTRAR
jgi:hypothetical protein